MRAAYRCCLGLSLVVAMLQFTAARAAESFYFYENSQIPIDPAANRVSLQFAPGTPIPPSDSFCTVHPSLDLAISPMLLPRGIRVYTLRTGSDFASACGELLSDTSIIHVMPCYQTLPDSTLVQTTDRIYVEFVDGISTPDMMAVLDQFGLTFLDSSRYDHGNWTCELIGGGVRDPIAAANRLQEHPLTQWACPDFVPSATLDAVPADNYFSKQWYLRDTASPIIDIDAEFAWEFGLIDSSMIIAILDGGLTSHWDLPLERLLPGFDFAGDIRNDFIGRDDPPDSNVTPGPDKNHGMAVAGVLAASHDPSQSVAGVFASCRILPVKIFHNNGPPASSGETAEAIRFAYANGARVLSNSWTIPDSTSTQRGRCDQGRGVP